MPPALALSLLLVAGSAAVFHTLFGRTLRGLGVASIAALAGFLAGEALARWWGLERGQIGVVHAAPGLAGAWLAMAAAWRGRWR